MSVGGQGRLQGKVALITGSTRGIGRTIGLRFAQQGASVVITGEDSKDADSALAAIADSGGKAIFVEADLTTEQDVVRLVESTIAEYGQLTTLVNNASVNPMAIGDKTVADVENESLEQAVALNYFGLVWMCKYSLPHLLAAERASITNISSVVTYLGGPNFTAYCLSKGAVEPLTRSLYSKYVETGLRVNAINCGMIATERLTKILEDKDHVARTQVGDRVSRLPYPGTPDDVAWASVYLASDEAMYVTNATLSVNGGVTT